MVTAQFSSYCNVCVCIGNLPLAFAIISIIFFSFRFFRSICLALAFSYSINSMCFVSSIFAVANNSLQGCHAMRHISTIVYSYCDLCICWSATRHKMSKSTNAKKHIVDIFIFEPSHVQIAYICGCFAYFAISCV